MAVKVSVKVPERILGGPPLAAQVASLVQGAPVGFNSDGYVVLADCRASAGPIICRGFLAEDAQVKDALGNAVGTQSRVPIARDGVLGGYSSLTPGTQYYLGSGGAITTTKPASATGDIDQVVAFVGNRTTELVISIGDPVAHA